ncbi:hypothetical protein [Mycobacterium sp.]|uniref:hypothetical protein n=1 Tax=Mycobacterium sp. TaxID=1785 RepID=UPI003F9B68E2
MLISDTGRRAGRLVLRLCFVGPDRCNICGSRVRFWSFPRKLRRQAARHGFPRRVLEFAPSAYLRGRADLQHRTADLMMAGVDDVVDITDMPCAEPRCSILRDPFREDHTI